MNQKLQVGVIGASGYVGQRLLCLLEDHPYFEPTFISASGRSVGQSYGEAIEGRWKLDQPMPERFRNMKFSATEDLEKLDPKPAFVFCAVDMPKQELLALEEQIARWEIPVISNNSANRWTSDVPLLIPEINPEHLSLIPAQRKRLGTQKGFIVCKPNCSIQSYVPALTPLMDLGLEEVVVATYQAVSGAGKRLSDWPEMDGNIIPYIGGEEEKSEREPSKIWADLKEEGLVFNALPRISAQCFRVPVQEGHSAAVWMRFKSKPEREEILRRWKAYRPTPQELDLPNAPQPFLNYFEERERPQPKLDAQLEKGMQISIGGLREDSLYDYKFTCLSHNTLRGAGGGSMLTAELLYRLGYFA